MSLISPLFSVFFVFIEKKKHTTSEVWVYLVTFIKDRILTHIFHMCTIQFVLVLYINMLILTHI